MHPLFPFALGVAAGLGFLVGQVTMKIEATRDTVYLCMTKTQVCKIKHDFYRLGKDEQ